VVSIADPKDPHKAALRVVVFSQLFPLGIAVAREFIGQLQRSESSW
jgi:hypothetical protein